MRRKAYFLIVILASILVSGDTMSSFAKPSRMPNQLIDAVLKDACSSGCSEEQIAEYQRSIKSELHDLNADSIFELFIYIDHGDLCGAGFNCSFWIFQRQRSGYRLLLKDYPVVRVGTQTTRGFKDLESQGRMGGCLLPDGKSGREIYLTVFKWNGKEYKAFVVGEQCRPRMSSQLS